MKRPYRYISSDTHLDGLPNRHHHRVPKQYQELLPRLVELPTGGEAMMTEDFELHRVSFPYARPELDLFLRRLSAQYRAACGERLVVIHTALEKSPDELCEVGEAHGRPRAGAR